MSRYGQVYYTGGRLKDAASFISLIREAVPGVAYLNSLFSLKFFSSGVADFVHAWR